MNYAFQLFDPHRIKIQIICGDHCKCDAAVFGFLGVGIVSVDVAVEALGDAVFDENVDDGVAGEVAVGGGQVEEQESFGALIPQFFAFGQGQIDPGALPVYQLFIIHGADGILLFFLDEPSS